MKPFTSLRNTFSILALTLLFCQYSYAHNGKVAYAHPLGKIIIDGDFSDWRRNAIRYNIGTLMSDTKPGNDSDFSSFFQVGYRVDDRSLYIAFTVTDDDFIEDTSENVRFNTQDCLELCLDARHLTFGSGVASFMYSKKLRNINNAYFDPFARVAKWDIVEVAVVRKGNTRYYEWRISLGEHLTVGKSVGLDVNVFDKDADGSFTSSSWGKGDSKFRIPGSLGDVILLPEDKKMSTISGQVSWDRKMNARLPAGVRVVSIQNPALWLTTEVDSSGNYSVEIPAGKYELTLPDPYFQSGKEIYSAIQKKQIIITTKTGQLTGVEKLVITGAPVPHLIPEKGVLQDFNPAVANQVDDFIQSYQKYYGIPGVSLALIKDGKLVYHKTYGVKNTFTGEKVDSNTLFEAASVTKPVFSFAVQRLAERRVIDLDKPLYLYLPYPDIAYDERYKLMTARHVLTHRTGFPNWRWMNDDQKLNLRFTPGTDYNYSGEGFEYLKMVVEKITGKKVEQVLKEEVLDPVGLYHTFFSRNDSLKRMVANGHFDRLPTFDELPESPGMAYSMHTEAKVFTKFMMYMIEQKGLNAKTYDTMYSKHSEYKYDPGDPIPENPAYMGMSLEIRETPYGKTFGHGGNNGDFLCQFEVYRDLKTGYVIFTNSNTSYPLLRAMRQFLVEGKEK
ncbi:MAG: serine hydrolase [Chitinophagaceae bacterium]|nr:serine hydrolase [Chitinophagaceae bacterium]